MTARIGGVLEDYLDTTWLGRAVLSLGEADFAHSLVRALEALVPVDHLAVIVFDTEFVAHLAGAGSRHPGNVALEAGRLYERARFYRHDPGAQQLESAGGATGPIWSRLRATDIGDPKYRREIYDRFRLLERLSVTDQIRNRWLMLNFYRGLDSETFSERDRVRLHAVAPLLLSLAAKHALLVAPSNRSRQGSVRFLEDLLVAIEGRLTPRERAVCARALAGQTVDGIASELGVRPPTVATLRRRAYGKLNISSLNQLFARCMEQLARGR